MVAWAVMSKRAVVWIVVAACGGKGEDKAPAPPPDPGPDVATRDPHPLTPPPGKLTPEYDAQSFASMIVMGKIEDAVHAWFSPELAKALPAEQFHREWDKVTENGGKILALVGVAPTPASGGTHVLVRYRFEHGVMDETLGFTNGPIASIHGGLLEPYDAPAYAPPDAAYERVAWLGSGDAALPATIVAPKAAKDFPLVIFVHGSGGGDEDDSAPGGMRIFRDLAGGLAAKGIGSLRWVKRTHPPYGALSKLDPKTFTVKQEYLDDVATAIALARTIPGVDPKRIYLAGHSEGGWLVPWLLKDHPELAGGVTLAGNARPFASLVPGQFRYMAKVSGQADNPLAQAQIAKEDARAKRALDPNLPDDTPADDLPLGIAGAAAWRSIARYDAPATAKALAQPMLVLQGGRDYQVTAEDDLPLWKAALAGKTGSSTKLYPKVNHDFVPGEGPITPQEYETGGGHVEDDVVTDIAAWIQPPR